jgi:multidrug efflux pump
MRSAPPTHGPHDPYATPFYSRFRSTVAWSVRHRGLVIGLTILALVL